MIKIIIFYYLKVSVCYIKEIIINNALNYNISLLKMTSVIENKLLYELTLNYNVLWF
jgi:hypothetical protein